MHWLTGVKAWLFARCNFEACGAEKKDEKENLLMARNTEEASWKKYRVAPLRCERCYGTRSSWYQESHLRDPENHPAIGVYELSAA
ncbi:hypothetical protein N7466_001462 [Penicillium verhagenii]|uniref:uncharacterized protein n=1 Tax=Penicillium verhagenii TaxID=1562060 RepID=UPI0025456434|nr:uncharacterized protein N7466_001462 [Penicillium verhagenii]KAJ5938328.1 hypothetical protein N7466_001462 [Penicillium verhagenii]